ncbi:hypothetical protein C8R43DRAFT_1123565 [Mycena crocata]|nr:hypothetical protein C8R43DRAFT_1123565 [Mycena crocata]
MSTRLTFTDKKLLQSPLVGPEAAVYYTTTTTSVFRGRKVTTIMGTNGVVGIINWRDKIFAINDVQRKWKDLKKRFEFDAPHNTAQLSENQLARSLLRFISSLLRFSLHWQLPDTKQ